MSEQLYRVMSDDVKQLYCIESVDGEMFSMQEIVDLLNKQLSIIRRDEMSIKTMMSNIEKLEKENRVLNSIKKFAEDNGINIFYIDTAFRNCWNENENLVTKIRKQEDEIGYWKNKYDDAVETFEIDEATATKIRELEKENEQLRQKILITETRIE